MTSILKFGWIETILLAVWLLPISAFGQAQPYPDSAVIVGITLDWSTHQRHAQGSDNFQLTWADDDHLYGAWGDGGGFGGSNGLGRVGLGVARIEGSFASYRGYNVWGGHRAENPATFDGKSWGMISVDGSLYMWVVPDHPEGKGYRNHYETIELAKSPDHGATWTKAKWKFFENDNLTIPTFLNFGKNGAGVPEELGDYVYSYFVSPQSPTMEQAGTNGVGLIVHKPGKLFLARVPKDALMTGRSNYEFYRGLDGAGQPRWGSLSEKRPVFEDPNGVGWCMSASYNPAFERYLLCTEHSKSSESTLGIFDAPQPWGPWTTVEYYDDSNPFGVRGDGSDLPWRNNVFFAAFSTKWFDGDRFTLNFTGAGQGKDNDSFNTVEGKFERTGETRLDRVGNQWSPAIEWELKSESWEGNPFELTASVAFQHAESGERRTTGMFYDGDGNWRFRFSGTRAGEWTFATTSEDRDLDGLSGVVTIRSNPNTYGFVTYVGDKWARPKGKAGTLEAFIPQYVMYTAPDAFYNKPEKIDVDIKTFIVDHGFTGFHVPVLCRWFDLEKERASEIDDSDPNPDPRTFEALELLITKVHAAGGVVHLWVWGDEQRSMTPGKWGTNGSVDRRLQRYIAARLGPLPGWTMSYGFDLWEWADDEQLTTWHRYLHDHFGWPHLLGARSQKNALTQLSEAMDYAAYEQHRPDFDTYVKSLEKRPDKPSFSEDRFRIRNSPEHAGKDYDEIMTRRGLWHSAMAAGVANIWGNLISPDVNAQNREGSFPYPHPHWMKTYAEFFRDRFHLDLERDASITDGACLRTPDGDEFLVYKEETRSLRMDLSKMTVSRLAVAVDAMKPYHEIDLGRLKPEAQTWQAPYQSDWAIAIGKPLAFSNITDSAGTAGPTAAGKTGGHGAMFADLDADGLPDLYITMIFDDPMPELFYRNRGDGRFVEEGNLRGIADFDGGSHGSCFADLDNDGDFDLFNGTTWDHKDFPAFNNVFQNDGRGRFAEVTGPGGLPSERNWPTRGVLCLDMDNDGDLDLFGATNYQGSNDPVGERNEVYLNEGGFRFLDVDGGDLSTAPCGQGATDTDYDGDGDIDVIAANRTGPVNILRNDGTGHFSLVDPASIGIQHRAKDGITMGDLDNDGDLDMVLAGADEGFLYKNLGGGRFAFVRAFSGTDGYMGGLADLDNDSDLDLVFAGDSQCWLNDGSGKFHPGSEIPIGEINDPRGIAFADMDNDGDLDFAVACKRSGNLLVRNDGDAGNNWLKIRLISPQGQAGAFGAKVSIYAPDGDLLGMREARGNNGYLGQNDPVLHFGLGKTTAVEVRVAFLDGTEKVVSTVGANRTLTADGR
jgi:hypothetical protein